MIEHRDLHERAVFPTNDFELRILFANNLMNQTSLIASKRIDLTIFDVAIWVANVDEIILGL